MWIQGLISALFSDRCLEWSVGFQEPSSWILEVCPDHYVALDPNTQKQELPKSDAAG
jgi:hypothetical protein